MLSDMIPNWSNGSCRQMLWAGYTIANKFNVLNHRPAKFGMSNNYGLLCRGITYQLL